MPAIADLNIKRIVLTVHGIRTFGQWQERFGDLLKNIGYDGKILHFKYGYFSSLAFLVPPLRFLMVLRFARYLSLVRSSYPNASISLVGHSFGTHLIGWALIKIVKKAEFPGDVIILAGSVLKPTFPWNRLISQGAARTILNECGTRDSVLVLNQLVALGTGMAGRLGFIGLLDDTFSNNYFDFGHGGYFVTGGLPSDHFMRDRWVPLVTSGLTPPRVDERVPGGPLAGIFTWLLQNSEPIKLVAYSVPLWLVTATSLYLYIGAVSRQLAAQALSFKAESPDLAMLLAVEASRLHDTIETRGALLEVLQFNPAYERLLALPSGSGAFTYDHSGKTLYIGGGDGCVYSFDAASHAHGTLFCLPSDISFLTFSNDDSSLLIVDGNGRLRDWDSRTGKFRGKAILAHADEGDEPTVVAVLPNSQRALSTGADQTLKIWDFADEPHLIRSIPLSIDPVSLIVHPDGHHIIIGGANGEVSVWNLDPKLHLLRTIVPHSDYVSLALSHKGSQLASVGLSDPYLRFWSPISLTQIRAPIPLPRGGANDVAFSLDDSKVEVSNTFDTISVFDLSANNRNSILLNGVTTPLVVSPDGAHLATSAQSGGPAILDMRHPLSIGRRIALQSKSKVIGVKINSAGDRISAIHANGILSITDLASGDVSVRLVPHSKDIYYPFSFSNDGNLLATGSNNTVCIYDVQREIMIRCVTVGNTVHSLQFNKRGSLLAVGGLNSEIMILRSDTGDERLSISLNRKHHVDPGDGEPTSDLPVSVESFEFGADDRILVVGGSDGEIDFVDVDKKVLAGTKLTGHTNAVFGVCLDASGKRLVSASSDGSVRFWQTQPGVERGLPLKTDASTQHLACSRDFRTVAVGNGRGVSVFDTSKDIRIGVPLSGSGSFINSVSISEDGQTLAASSEDDVLVWTLKAKDLASKACQIVNRNLTTKEWQQYVGNVIPYRQTCFSSRN